jgi:hypothetical protein
MKTAAAITTAALALVAAAGAAAQAPVPAAVTTVCTPPTAVVVVGRREIKLPAPSACYSRDQTTGGGSVVVGDIAGPSMRATPRFTVRRGTIVRFRFDAEPQGTVVLRVRRGERLQSHATYRLSPFATTWRARGRGGVLTLSVPFAPITTPWGTTARNHGHYVLRFAVR